MKIADLLASVREFEREAATILGQHEDAPAARVYNARASLKLVASLSFAQADSLKQAVRCVESELFRAAFVMAWTTIADLLLEIAVKESAKIALIRSGWNLVDKTALSEAQGDHGIIQALKDAGILSKGQMKTLHGMLHRRNECSHPSSFHPGPNESLGFIAEAIAMSKVLHALL